MYLLDTHALYWFLTDSPSLPEQIKQLIETTPEPAFISIATFWEMAIKSSLGKLKLPEPISSMALKCEQLGFRLLPVLPAHLERLALLPWIHRDPFDRLLISQAMEDRLTLLSKDKNVSAYDVPVLWESD